MDIVLLRKLALKSPLNFGKYSDRSVVQCMAFAPGRSYLRWAYFNMSRITFKDDILDDLLIPQDLRIVKPGTNDGNHRIMKQRFTDQYNGEAPEHVKEKNDRYKKKRMLVKQLSSEKLISKQSLKNINNKKF